MGNLDLRAKYSWITHTLLSLFRYAGAGFYVNATNPKYAKYYNMLTHVTEELPKVIQDAGLPIVRLVLLCIRRYV